MYDDTVAGIVILMFPMIIFLVFVAPIWIIFHYRAKTKQVNGLSMNERSDLEELMEVANRMAGRIETLESILDVESPGWREKQAGSRHQE